MEYVVVAAVVILVIVWLSRSASEGVVGTDGSGGTNDVARKGAVDNVVSVDDVVSIIDPLDDQASITRSFRSVFAMMSDERRTALVAYYMRQHGCGEHEAMRFAIVDRQNDEDRFR